MLKSFQKHRLGTNNKHKEFVINPITEAIPVFDELHAENDTFEKYNPVFKQPEPEIPNITNENEKMNLMLKTFGQLYIKKQSGKNKYSPNLNIK